MASRRRQPRVDSSEGNDDRKRPSTGRSQVPRPVSRNVRTQTPRLESKSEPEEKQPTQPTHLEPDWWILDQLEVCGYAGFLYLVVTMVCFVGFLTMSLPLSASTAVYPGLGINNQSSLTPTNVTNTTSMTNMTKLAVLCITCERANRNVPSDGRSFWAIHWARRGVLNMTDPSLPGLLPDFTDLLPYNATRQGTDPRGRCGALIDHEWLVERTTVSALETYQDGVAETLDYLDRYKPLVDIAGVFAWIIGYHVSTVALIHRLKLHKRAHFLTLGTTSFAAWILAGRLLGSLPAVKALAADLPSDFFIDLKSVHWLTGLTMIGGLVVVCVVRNWVVRVLRMVGIMMPLHLLTMLAPSVWAVYEHTRVGVARHGIVAAAEVVSFVYLFELEETWWIVTEALWRALVRDSWHYQYIALLTFVFTLSIGGYNAARGYALAMAALAIVGSLHSTSDIFSTSIPSRLVSLPPLLVCQQFAALCAATAMVLYVVRYKVHRLGERPGAGRWPLPGVFGVCLMAWREVCVFFG